jgi:hypothetical protein
MRVISQKDNTYELLDLVTNKPKKYHVKDIHPFHFNPSITDPVDIARRDYLEFFIEQVLDHKGDPRRKSSLKFLIKWVGYDNTYNSWEPWKNFRDTGILHQYLRDNKMSRLITKKP